MTIRFFSCRRYFCRLSIVICLLLVGVSHSLTHKVQDNSGVDDRVFFFSNASGSAEQKRDGVCVDGLILDAWRPVENISVGQRVGRGFAYFALLVYLFIGVAIVCDQFMAAIEVITCSERKIVTKTANGRKEVTVIRVWNETVANLTLMAFASSAPEILLSVIELFQKKFEAGDLGPGTIVGSAAYNMFVIIAICISAVPSSEVRRIKHLRVFLVTAAWSLFAYIWLYAILAWISPGRVEIWEGLLTLLFFVVTVLHAYIAERNFLCYKHPKEKTIRRKQIVSSDSEPPGVEEFIRMEVSDDEIFEEDKQFYVSLHNPSESAMLCDGAHYGEPIIAPDDELTQIFQLATSKPANKRSEEEKVFLLGQPKIGDVPCTDLRIKESDAFQNTIDKLLKRTNAAQLLGTSSWREQFTEALALPGVAQDDSDDDEVVNLTHSCVDYVMHFITLFWKILFTLIPPADLCDGYPCFMVSLLFIGFLTAIITDAASHFGCTVGMSDALTAISVVSIGTSIPDTFASKIAAIQDKTADNSIGNVTGSNAVNVFVGIGIAWTLGAIYHKSYGRDFQVLPGSLAFAITIYIVGAIICISVILRRRRQPIGGELGGPVKYKILHSGLFILIYILYILLSALKSYGVLKGF